MHPSCLILAIVSLKLLNSALKLPNHVVFVTFMFMLDFAHFPLILILPFTNQLVELTYPLFHLRVISGTRFELLNSSFIFSSNFLCFLCVCVGIIQ